MQNIEYLKEQNAVLVPLQQWKKLQDELAKLKKRVKKSEVLTDLKKSLAELETDLRDENYNADKELSADNFLAQLKNEQ